MRICFVAPRFPLPANKGDKLRIYHELRVLSRTHAVSLLALADEPVAPESVREIEGYCERVEVVPLNRAGAFAGMALAGPFVRAPLQTLFYRSKRYAERLKEWLGAGRFDIVHGNNVRIAPYLWERSKRGVVLDLTDAQTLNLRSRRDLSRFPSRLAYGLELGRIARYEREVVAHFPSIVVAGEADRDALGGGDIAVVPNGVDTGAFAYTEEGREPALLVMTGNMGYGPNVDAAVWFAREAWPQLRAANPTLRWAIVGARPAEAVRVLGRTAGIEVTGAVDDVAAYLRRASLAIAPIRSGSGIQNKVLEALACGTPVVATSLANRAIGGIDGRQLMLADTGETTLAAVQRLLDAPALRLELARAGSALVRERFSWEAHARALEGIYETVAAQASYA